jgi:hypothetical protein
VKTFDNTLTFSLGPLVALTASGGFNGKNLRSLSKSIGIYLESSFELYRSDNLDSTDVNILGKEFLIDHSRALDFIANKIKDKIIAGHYYMDTAKNIWLANQLIEHARLGLIYEKTSSLTSGYLRDQLDTFMDSAKAESRQNTLILEFNYLMPKSNNQFKLEITQNELVENGIVSWGKRALLDTAEYASFKAQLLHQNSHNIRKYLTTLISVLGDGEKVRIFPLLDRGDANTGYEFLTDSTKLDWKILPNGEMYFDIDLNNEKSLYMLQHIINLLYTGKFAFVVKKPTGTWNDGEMIFAFNRDGFLEPSELYSQNMEISDYSTIFRGDNEKWRRLWIYPKAWSADLAGQNNDIRSYRNYIVDPTQDNKHINAFMREYMNRMELLFPGYRLTMYKYLFFNIKP